MTKLLRTYRFINNTSLDVVLGAVTSVLFFSKVIAVTIRFQGILVLGLSVWIIYTIDHLSDASKIKHVASTERHRFHQRNFLILSMITVLAVLTNIVMIFYLRTMVLKAGIVLSCVVALYLVINRKLRYVKEVFGALFYTAGVVLAPLALAGFVVNAFTTLLIVQFMCTAWINLLLFAWFDRTYDEKDKHVSFATIAGEHHTKMFIRGLFFICMMLTVYQSFGSFMWPALILANMTIVLLAIFTFHKYFNKRDRYRFLGDAVFLFPWIYLLW